MAYIGFKKLKKKLAAKGAKNPAALAAWIGRKKYGKKKFQAAAAKGRKMNPGFIRGGDERGGYGRGWSPDW